MSRLTYPLRAGAFVLALVSGIACFTASVAAGPGRIEAYPIQTVDASTAQVYWPGGSSDTAWTPRTIAGELRLPLGPAPKVPAVVFLHGDAGAIANQPPWIDAFVAMGFAVFTVDSFTGRGLVARDAQKIGFDAPTTSPATRVVDAYAALAILAAHPRIDPTRIALMGVSSGARTTILAAMKRFSVPLARGPSRFAAYVALYPPCNVTLVDDDKLEAGPLRIFIGAADNITRADACARYVGRLRASGIDADITTYAGAYHGFDNPPGTPSFSDPGQPSFSACQLVERDHALVNIDTGLPPAPGDRCETKGFTAGRDAAADAAVRSDVRAFLTQALK